jgi:beta-lactamase regulating signal transducer with metallopeptidase domain
VIEAGLAAKSIIATLAMMALQGTILAVIGIVLVRITKLRPAFAAAVWLVVLAKFALPWGPAMPWSLSDLFAALTGSHGGGGVVIVNAKAAVHTHSPALGAALGWLVLAFVWSLGTAIVLARGIARHRGALHVARSATDAPAFARELVAELAMRLRVKQPRLVVGDDATGPYVVGLLRPIIVVPPAIATRARNGLADATLLRAALLHELAHVKRRDALGRLVQLAAVALFWWLPVTRIVSRRLELARERACDAWALESGDVSRPAYARLLLQMAQLRSTGAALAAPHGLDARVTSVLGPVERPRLSRVHKLALLAWVVLALGGARRASAHAPREVCVYTPQIAEALREAYPEADADHDGVVSHTEACEFQAVQRKHPAAASPILAEPLCCNCGESEGLSSPLTTDASCRSEEGVSR